MAGIWTEGSDGWELASPSGFPAEADLHALVAEAPQVLPLAGAPRIAVLGSEVQLGSGFVDIVAVEEDGRPVIIEVKLGRNAEAGRAVVAQILSYAAYMQGLDATALRDTVASQLHAAGFQTIEEAAAANDDEGTLDPDRFREALDAHLAEGRFRLVLVLDEAPTDLVRLIGYLESITTDRIVVDLVTVAQFDVGDRTVLLPQRIDPERVSLTASSVPRRTVARKSEVSPGADGFELALANSSEEVQEFGHRLVSWARTLEAEGLAVLTTAQGSALSSLRLRLPGDEVGLGNAFFDQTRVTLTLARTVFERAAPKSLPRIEELIAPQTVGQGRNVEPVTDELLAAIADAYREAAGR